MKREEEGRALEGSSKIHIFSRFYRRHYYHSNLNPSPPLEDVNDEHRNEESRIDFCVFFFPFHSKLDIVT